MRSNYASVFLVMALIFIGLTVFQIITISLKSPYLLVVEGLSMQPTLKPNDLLIIERVRPDDISLGDIVVIDYGLLGDYLQFSTGYIVHRVVELRESDSDMRVMTRGDNAKHHDGFIEMKYVLGRLVYSVPILGILIAPPSNFVIIILGFLLFSILRRK